jgi:DNA repair protein RecO (recombination protein O)
MLGQRVRVYSTEAVALKLMVARGRELDVVTQASTIDPLREVRDDLVKSSYAFHLTELVDAFLQDRDPHPDVFSLLVDALQALADGDVELDVVARHFEVRLLATVGFGPELVACLACRAEIREEANWYSVTSGGVLCPRCGGHEASAGPIDVRVLKMLRHLQRTPSPSVLAVRVPTSVREELERLLRRQVEFVLERKLRATDFVHRVATPVSTAET